MRKNMYVQLIDLIRLNNTIQTTINLRASHALILDFKNIILKNQLHHSKIVQNRLARRRKIKLDPFDAGLSI